MARRIAPEVLAARGRVLAERKAGVDAYLRGLRDYKPQARYTREKFVPERSVGGPPRPRMDSVVGEHVMPGRAWRGIRMTANTDTRNIGGPGDMRIQGKRLAPQWDEPVKPVWYQIDHQTCDGCGFRIDLRKHEYYNIGERTLCEKCGG